MRNKKFTTAIFITALGVLTVVSFISYKNNGSTSSPQVVHAQATQHFSYSDTGLAPNADYTYTLILTDQNQQQFHYPEMRVRTSCSPPPVSVTCSRSGSLAWGGGNCSNPDVNYQNVSPGTQKTTQSTSAYTGSITYQCNSSGGWDYIGETCAPPLPSCVFSATPSFIVPPQSSSLSWSCDNANSCSIDNGIGSVGVNGSSTVKPSQTTTYTLSCNGTGGSTSFQTTVRTARFDIREVAP